MSQSIQIVCPNCGKLNRVPQDRSEDVAHCGSCRKRLFSEKAVKVDDDQLRRHIQKNQIPVLVDYWAPWCGPCKMMAPVYEQVAAEFEPAMRFLKLNTEQYPDVAAQMGIRSIPTMILFSGGREKARISGAMDRAGMTRWIQQNK